MDPAKSQRRCKNRDVARLQAIHRVLVSVKANESALRRNVHVRGALGVAAQAIVTVLEAVGEDVRHRHQFGVAVFDTQGIRGCATAAPAAANQGDLKSFIALGMDERDRHPRQGGDGGHTASGFDKFTTGGDICCWIHN
jgi:hypothetical protein